MSARRDDPDVPHPFCMQTFANSLLAGMAARHAPVPDEREVEPNFTEHEEYQAYLDSTTEPPCK